MRHAGLVCCCLVVVGLALVPTDGRAAEKYRAKVAGGPVGGTFNTFATAMASFLPQNLDGLKISAVGSGGSVENVKRVSSGECDFGLCYAVDAHLGRAGQLSRDTNTYDGVRALGFLYGAPAQLVVRRDSGLATAMDLRGKRVAVGNIGSGAAASAERFFRHLGIWDQLKTQFLGYSDAASAFADEEIDAFWVLVGYPNRAIIEAAVRVDIDLLDVGTEAAASGFYDAFDYLPTEIPAGIYGADMPARTSFQDATFLCAHADVPNEVVYRITEQLWSEQGIAAMVAAKKTFGAMSLETGFDGTLIPLHPGAARFWTEMGKTVPDTLK